MERLKNIKDAVIDYELDGSTLNIVVSGRIDAANSSTIENMFKWMLADKYISNIVIDAKDLVYISSSGLRWILYLRKINTVLSLEIKNTSASVSNIIYITGFDNILTVS